MKGKFEKRGVAGNIMITIIATIIIFAILLVFVLFSGFVKWTSSVDDGVKYDSFKEVGLMEVNYYMDYDFLFFQGNKTEYLVGDKDILKKYFGGKNEE